MNLPELIPGTFVQRDNRFRATVQVEGRETWAFVPNSGRLTDLFIPGRPVWLQPAGSSDRKTAYDLKLVEHGEVLVSVDARLPNPLIEEYWREMNGGVFTDLGEFQVQREVMFGESRLDFQLRGSKGVGWVEAKSVTLVEDGVARFPDAPTDRGRRHLSALMDAVRGGDCSVVVFVVQRPDADTFSPHHDVDPRFAETLAQAEVQGVGVRAYTCRVSLSEIHINREIPCVLD